MTVKYININNENLKKWDQDIIRNQTSWKIFKQWFKNVNCIDDKSYNHELRSKFHQYFTETHND